MNNAIARQARNGFEMLRLACRHSVADADCGARSLAQPLTAWALLSGICIAVVALAVLALEPPHIWTAPWDVLLLLDGGWRIFEGQIPHTDFYNPIGVLTYWMVALGFHIGGPSLTGLVYGNLIFLIVVASWGGFIFSRKLPASFAFLLTLFLAVLIVAARPLGWDPATTTYAMLYNRYGWTLISILFIQLFVPDQSSASRSAAFDSISSGLLLGLLFFCKLNFFVFGIVAMPLAVLLRPELRGWIVATAIGFAMVCVGFWLAAGVDPMDYARDFAFAGKSQSFRYRITWLRHILKLNFIPGLLITGIWLYLIALPAMRRETRRSFAIKSLLIVGYVLGSALIITLGNTAEHNDVPLFLVAGVIVLEAWRRQQSVPAESARLPRAHAYAVSSAIVVAIFFGGIFTKDVISLANCWSRQRNLLSGGPSSQRFDARSLRDFGVPDTANLATVYWRVADIPARINEGLALLRRNISPQSQVAVLGYMDPFSFALGLKPPKGVSLWWDLGISFDRTHYPPPERVFSEANYVMYPIGLPEDGRGLDTVFVLHELYDRFLRQRYAETDRSVHWVLLEERH